MTRAEAGSAPRTSVAWRRRGPRGRRRIASGLAFLTLMLAPCIAAAAPPSPGRVVLLSAPDAEGTTKRTLTRIREELLAGGFDVTTLDPGPRRDPLSLAAVMEKQEDAQAVIAMVGEPEQPGAELWILDRVGTSPEVRRVPLPAGEGDQVAEVLAIRSIEMLKASALKLLLESRYASKPKKASPPAPAAPPAVVVTAPVDAPPRPPAFGLEMGLSLLASREGPGAAALPLVRARLRILDGVFVRVTAAGLGTRPRVETTIGATSVTQGVGLGELLFALRLGSRWRASFGVGAGALYLRSEGEGLLPPYHGLRQSQVVAAVDAGGGVLADLGRQVSLAFEVHGLLALPHPILRFDQTETAPVGYPALHASLTMVAWL